MELTNLANSLPTSAVELIAFIVLASLLAQGWMIRYFMTYIQKKNANLERTTQNFTQHLKDLDEKRDAERREMENRLRECIASK